VILQIEHRVRAMPVFRHPLIVEGVERAAESEPPLQKLLVGFDAIYSCLFIFW